MFSGNQNKPSGKKYIVPIVAGLAALLVAVVGGVAGYFLLRGDANQSIEEVFDQDMDENNDGDELKIRQEEKTYPVQISVYSAADVRTGQNGLLRDLLTGGKVNLRAEADNYEGEVLQTLEADENGQINAVLPAGIYTAEIDVAGYTPAYVNLEVAREETTAEGYVIPLPEQGQIGIMLTWQGEADLDLTLLTPFQSTGGDRTRIGGRFLNDDHGNKLVADNNAGCEVMYVNTGESGNYQLYVNNYTEIESGNFNSEQFFRLDSHVYIYDSTGLLAEYTFPKGQAGVVWEVAELGGGQVIPNQSVYGSQEKESWWAEDKWVLDLEESVHLRTLMDSMVLAAGLSSGGMQTWADNLTQGNWNEMGELLATVATWKYPYPKNEWLTNRNDIPYIEKIMTRPEVSQVLEEQQSKGLEGGWLLTKEQLEYLAFAASGRRWKLEDISEVEGVSGYCQGYPIPAERIGDSILFVYMAGDPDTYVSFKNAVPEYIGGGRWRVTANCIRSYTADPEWYPIAEIAFTVIRNPDSCFDGYSIAGMSVTPADNSGWAQAYLNKMDEEAQYVAGWSTWKYDLVFLDDDNIPELVSGPDDCWVSVYTWRDGQLHTMMDEWGYGTWGNYGYEYIEYAGIVWHRETQDAGAIDYSIYDKVNENYEWDTLMKFRTDYYIDTNGNGWADGDDQYLEDGINYIWDAASNSYLQITQEEKQAASKALGLSGASWRSLTGWYDPDLMRWWLKSLL